MAAKSTTRAMSDRHEAFLATLIDGRTTPGSGNGFANQMDVRNDSDTPYALAVDGKSTKAASISFSLATWDKAVEQAHGEEPALAFRFYHDDRLVRSTDFVMVTAEFFGNLLDAARLLADSE